MFIIGFDSSNRLQFVKIKKHIEIKSIDSNARPLFPLIQMHILYFH